MSNLELDEILYDLKLNYLKKEELYRNNRDFDYVKQNRIDYDKVRKVLESLKTKAV